MIWAPVRGSVRSYLTTTRSSYDAVADDYAELVKTLFAKEPLGRGMPAAFAELVQADGGLVADLGRSPSHRPCRVPEPARRLGYLLKHAQLRLAEPTAAALAPYGLDGRELAVLVVLGSCEPASQQQAARRLGIDRTTMVAFLDALEGKGLVARRPRADDRRKNVVELRAAGRDTLRRVTQAADDAERRFLAPLTSPTAQQLRDALHTLIQQDASVV